MPQKFGPGDTVEQVLPTPVRGTVVDFALDKTTGDVQFEVAWRHTDDDGVDHVQSRFFTEEQLKLIKSAKEKPETAEKGEGSASEEVK